MPLRRLGPILASFAVGIVLGYGFTDQLPTAYAQETPSLNQVIIDLSKTTPELRNSDEGLRTALEGGKFVISREKFLSLNSQTRAELIKARAPEMFQDHLCCTCCPDNEAPSP